MQASPCGEAAEHRYTSRQAYSQPYLTGADKRFQIGELMGEKAHLSYQAKRKGERNRPEMHLTQCRRPLPQCRARGGKRLHLSVAGDMRSLPIWAEPELVRM